MCSLQTVREHVPPFLVMNTASSEMEGAEVVSVICPLLLILMNLRHWPCRWQTCWLQVCFRAREVYLRNISISFIYSSKREAPQVLPGHVVADVLNVGTMQ